MCSFDLHMSCTHLGYILHVKIVVFEISSRSLLRRRRDINLELQNLTIEVFLLAL